MKDKMRRNNRIPKGKNTTKRVHKTRNYTPYSPVFTRGWGHPTQNGGRTDIGAWPDLHIQRSKTLRWSWKKIIRLSWLRITCSRQCVCLTIRRFSFSEKLWNTTIQKNCFQYRKIKRQKITLREDLVNWICRKEIRKASLRRACFL